MVTAAPIVLSSSDILAKRGATWSRESPYYLVENEIAVTNVFASDASSQAAVQLAKDHSLATGDKIVIQGTSCLVCQADGCYTVAAIINSRSFSVVEQIAHNQGVRGCPICGGGTMGIPRDLTGYTFAGQVRSQDPTVAYGPPAVGNINIGSCEFTMTGCKPLCPPVSRCQLVDIPEAGITQAHIVKVETIPAKEWKGPGNCTNKLPERCVVTLSELATTGGSAQMILNSDILATFELAFEPECAALSAKLQTSGLPIAACCSRSILSDDGATVTAFGPYIYDIAATSPTGDVELIASGEIYLQATTL